MVEFFSKCGLVTDFRTFYEDFVKCIKFCEWVKEHTDG